MFFYEDPKHRPISRRHFKEENPDEFDSVAMLCVLATSGVSDIIKTDARKDLSLRFGFPIDILRVRYGHRRDLFLDDNSNEWKYVCSVPDFCNSFIDSFGELDYVTLN